MNRVCSSSDHITSTNLLMSVTSNQIPSSVINASGVGMIRADRGARTHRRSGKARAPRVQRALEHLAPQCAAAAAKAKAAALAAEKRKLTRLHFASVRSAVCPSARSFVRHRVSSEAAAAAGARTGSSPLHSVRDSNPLERNHLFPLWEDSTTNGSFDQFVVRVTHDRK